MRAERPEIFNTHGDVHHALHLNYDGIYSVMDGMNVPRDAYRSLAIITSDLWIDSVGVNITDGSADGWFGRLVEFERGGHMYGPVIALRENYKPSHTILAHELGHLASWAQGTDHLSPYLDDRLVRNTRRIGAGVMALAPAALLIPGKSLASSGPELLTDVARDVAITLSFTLSAYAGWKLRSRPQKTLWMLDKEERRARKFARRHKDTEFIGVR